MNTTNKLIGVTTMKQQIEKRVPSAALATIERLIINANKRASKLNLPEITFSVTDRKTETVENSGEKYVHETVLLTITGEIPKISGWNLIAVTDKTEIANIVKNLSSDIAIPAMYRNRIECDHCNMNRQRKYTAIIHNSETNKYMQVGFSCLQDFFPKTKNIQQIAEYAYYIIDTVFNDEHIESHCYCGRGEAIYDLKRVLCVTDAISETIGYVSGKKAYEENIPSTKEAVATILFSREKSDFEKIIMEKSFETDRVNKVNTLLEKYNAVMSETNNEETTDYEHNVRTLLALGYTTYKNLGYAVSILPFLYRTVTKHEQKNAYLKSEYVGNIGDKLSITVNVTFVGSFSTMYGVTHIYVFTDDNGNCFKWNSSNNMQLNAGNSVTLKGTIKDHSEYKGTKQTVLTRCKILSTNN